MIPNTDCPIWGTAAAKAGVPGYIDVSQFESPRTGGHYRVDGLTGHRLGKLDDETKLKLTTWLVEERRLGEKSPLISSEVIEQVQNSRLLSPDARRDQLLMFVAARCPRLNDQLKYRGPQEDPAEITSQKLLASTECLTQKELMRLIEFCDEWLENQNPFLRITLSGWRRIEALKAANLGSQQAFVAMWFDQSMDAAFKEAIELGVNDAGYKAFRVDQKEHNNKIDDEIIAEIRRSRFLIADFTCEVLIHEDIEHTFQRGGVYYEAGFAHGLGLPVIFTCRANMISHVHFDTRQFSHIVWENYEELRRKLTNRISATIGDGPSK